MEQSLLFSYTPSGGTEFVFVDPFDPSEVDSGDLVHTIPTAETSGDGEYQSDSHLAARMLLMKGTIVGDTLGIVQGRLNTLFAAHPKGSVGRFRQRLIDPTTGVLSDYFLACRVNNRKGEAQNGLPYRAWEIGYRAASPYWCEWTARSQALVTQNTTGSRTANFTAGGGESVLPVFSVVVTSPGVVTITPNEVFGLDSSPIATWTADVADTWVLDCEKRLLSRSGAAGVNQNERLVTGGFFALAPFTVPVVFGAGSGAAFNAVTVSWRQRFTVI